MATAIHFLLIGASFAAGLFLVLAVVGVGTLLAQRLFGASVGVKSLLKPRSREDLHRYYLWKIIKLDGPIQKNLGINIEYGVVISADEMVRETRAMLFCPLLNGLHGEQEVGLDPWHVEIKSIDSRNAGGQLPQKRMLLSTKIVLPITPDEINENRVEYGYLTRDQQKKVAERFAFYLPDFRDVARNSVQPVVKGTVQPLDGGSAPSSVAGML